METDNCKHTLMGHLSLTSGMELLEHILVSGNADSTVKVWDISQANIYSLSSVKQIDSTLHTVDSLLTLVTQAATMARQKWTFYYPPKYKFLFTNCIKIHRSTVI